MTQQSAEAAYSFTTKINGDLLTVRGDDAEQFKLHIQTLVQSGAIDYVLAMQEAASKPLDPVGANLQPVQEQAVQTVQAVMPGSTVIQDHRAQMTGQPQQQPQQSNVVQFPSVQPTAAPAQQQASSTPTCVHGARIHRSGVGKNGKPWSAWFCPTPKGTADQCDPEWG